MISTSISSPASGVMTVYILCLELFTDLFFRKLNQAARQGERMRFERIEAQRIKVSFIDQEGRALSRMNIEFSMEGIGPVHSLFVQTLRREAHCGLSAWVGDDKMASTIAVLEGFSRLEYAEIEELFPPIAIGRVN